MDPVQIVTRQDMESLLQIPRLKEFVRESFRRILWREPEPFFLSHAIRRLRFLPFYTRRRFLQKLLSSEEFRNLLHAQGAHLDKQRQALIHQRQELDQAQVDHCRRRTEFDLHQVLQSKIEGQNEMERREWQVLDLLSAGLTTADIGRRLFVSPVTVRRHVSAILRKLDVPDRQAAVDLLQEKS